MHNVTETCLAQPLELNCSADIGDSTYFPNTPIDNVSLADAIGDSPYLSNLYVYSFSPIIDGSCSRGKAFIEFCFENTQNIQNNTVHMNILLGRMDNDVNSSSAHVSGIVMERVDISTLVICANDNISVCCHSEIINVSLPTGVNVFGVLWPKQNFLEYNDSQYQVQTFVSTEFNFIGTNSIGQPRFETYGHTTNLSLRFLRFSTGKQQIDSDLEQNGSSTVNQIIVATVVPLIGISVIIILSVLAVAFYAVRRRQKWKRSNNIMVMTGIKSEGTSIAALSNKAYATGIVTESNVAYSKTPEYQEIIGR